MTNRIIKFRAWDGKKMSKIPFAITQDGILCSGNGVAYLATSITDSFVLMQFTGLHDKNGREIYEGDVVRGTFGGNYIVEIGKISGGGMDTGVIGFGWVMDDQDPEECEVIGNIYEHKELLK